jgi:hypothetical protein
MKLDNIGITIATRELDLDGKEKVLIKIGMPQEFPEGGSFFCPYRILGIGRGKVRYAGGVDPVQAVELALKCIATDLYTSPEFKADRLRHLGMRNLGFPTADAIRDLVPDD